jgi:hypothetical protein
LAGAFDETTRFRASKADHRDATLPLPARCAPCNPNWWIYFSLETDGPPVALAGDYMLTFTADPACATIPEQFRSRTYPATVTPFAEDNATQFRVALRGGSFIKGYDTFDAGVAGDTFAAMLGDFHGSPGIAEQVAANTYLGYEGSALAKLTSVGPSSITASFEGVVSYCELFQEPSGRYACAVEHAATRVLCTSTRHQLLLQPRTSGSLSR